MATDLRVVFDTNAAVSAVLLPRSISRRAFDVAGNLGRILLSDDTVAELDEVLRRPKFDKYITKVRRLEFLLSLIERAEIVLVDQRIAACRDPRDDKFLELALAGRASHLISGDDDLRVLNPFRGIAIISASEFLSSISS